MAHHNLDALDHKILTMISSNARIAFLEVARACDVSGAAIHQRVQKLVNQGVIQGSQFILDPLAIGLQTCAFVSLYLKDPSQFQQVADALRMIPEVVECYHTTGQQDLFIKIYAKSNHDLMNINHDKLQPLGLERTDTMIAYKEEFKHQMPIPEPEDD